MDVSRLKGRSRRRRLIQSIFWIAVPITIFGGLKYPLIGFVVPAVMIMGLVGGVFKGRFVCGWLCPRGAFFDRIMSKVSPRRKIPGWLRDYRFRWAVFAFLMGFMIWQLSSDPTNPYHWGAVFVRMCIITTAVGVVLAVAFHPRTWCSFCPMGTMQAATGGLKRRLVMDDGCKGCRTCEKACPLDLKIVDGSPGGRLESRDCLKCPECQLACPAGILKL